MDSKSNIPIYRAKKIDSDEYVLGLVSEAIQVSSNIIVWIWNKDGKYNIDPSTLAIHFPDMIDSEGTKIFASLSEDGRGGDIFDADSESDRCVVTVIFQDGYKIKFIDWDKTLPLPKLEPYLSYAKIIGIQE